MAGSYQKKFVPFGDYRPDPTDFDSPDLQDVKNLLPLFKGYRVLPQILQRTPLVGTSKGHLNAHAHLFTEERAVVAFQPNGDVHNLSDWYKEDDGTTDLWESIKGEFADTETWVQNDFPNLESYAHWVRPPVGSTVQFLPVWTYRALFSMEAATTSWTIDFRLVDWSSSMEIFSETVSGVAPVEQQVFTHVLTQPEIDLITDIDNVYMQFQDVSADGAGEALVEILERYSAIPQDTVGLALGNATPAPGQTVEEKKIEIVEDGIADPAVPGVSENLVKFGFTTPGTWRFNFDLKESFKVTNALQEVKIRAFGRITSTPNNTSSSWAELYDDNGILVPVVASSVVLWGSGSSTTWHWVEAIFDGDDILESGTFTERTIAKIGIAGNGGGDVDSSGGNIAYEIVEIEIYTPETVACKVFFSKLEAPGVDDSSQDQTIIYSGSIGELHEEDADLDLPAINTGLDWNGDSWDFVTYGANIIATNFRVPLMIKAPTDVAFVELITNPADPDPRPQGRYVTTVQNHVILGDINYTGDPPGQANEVWWSGLNRPEDWVISKQTGADRQVMYHTAGRVTGLSGGNAGLVFKPTSVIRMSYVGGSLIFNIDVLVDGVGTVYPQSIVQAGHDTYFFTGSDFARIRGYSQFEFIGDNTITQSINDSIFGDLSFDPTAYGNISELENLIVGSYDDYTDLIWWWYRSKGDSEKLGPYDKQKAVVYNTRENRWSRVAVDEARDFISQTVTYPSFFVKSKNAIHRGTRLITRNSINGVPDVPHVSMFTDVNTYAGHLLTKTFTAQSFAGEPHHDLSMFGIRPILRPSVALPDDFSITVYAGEHPDYVNQQQNQQTTFARDKNSDGWLNFDIQGEFITVKFNVPSMTETAVAFEGAEYMYRIAGRR